MLKLVIVCYLATIALLASGRADAAPLEVKVFDRTKATFSDVLVIIESLDGKGEVFRTLSDANGSIPKRDLAPGLYRLIATCPYGPCETEVREFIVANDPIRLDITVNLKPTDGDGYWEGLHPLRVSVQNSRLQPMDQTIVIVRDSEKNYEKWYKTGADGTVLVEIPDAPMTFVVLCGGTLTSKTISIDSIKDLTSKGLSLTIGLETEQESCKPIPKPDAVKSTGKISHQATSK